MTEENRIFSRIEESLIQAVTTVLGIEKHLIDPREDLSSYGFDSITLTQLANQLNEMFSFVRLDASTFLEYTTLEALTSNLHHHYQKDFEALWGLAQLEEHTLPETSATIDSDSAYDAEPTTESAHTEMLFTSSEITGSLLLDSLDPVTEPDLHEQPPPFTGAVVSALDEPTGDVAIIGMAGQFPGAANIIELWENLLHEKNALTKVPTDRWDWQAIYGTPEAEGNLTDCCYGGFLDKLDRFDPQFFGISPLEAAQMDPQQKLVLQSAWETVENAGYAMEQLKGEDVGVYLGVQRNENLFHLMKNNRNFGPYTSIGNTHSILANRVSYFFDWKGNSLSVDTACSASSSALHLAYHALLRGEIKLALVGGVTVVQDPFSHIANRKMGLLTNEPQVRSFDEHSGGYLIGEGVATALLKPLAQAEQDGDYIYGVIKGCVVNQSGKTVFLTAPEPKSHVKVIQSALQEARLQPEDIDYLEGQGIGTELSDKAELKAYAEVFRDRANGSRPTPGDKLGIGSIKGNIGHVEAASGITSLIKVCLAMKHGLIPPVLNFQSLNWTETEAELPFAVVARTQAWHRRVDERGESLPRRAGVHNFGFGGLSAHFIIEEHENACEQHLVNDSRGATSGEELLVFSSKSQEQLDQYVLRFLHYLQYAQYQYFGIQRLNLDDVAHTLQIGRQEMDIRLAVVASSVEELVAKLQHYLGGNRQVAGLYTGTVAPHVSQHIAQEPIPASLYQIQAWDKIAEYWVKGSRLLGPAELLAAGIMARRGQRIPLPNFCFAFASAPDFQAVSIDFEPQLNSVAWQRFSGAFQALESIARELLLDRFQAWGMCLSLGEVLQPAYLQAALGIAPSYQRLFPVLLDILVKAGMLQKSTGGYRVIKVQRVDLADLKRRRDDFLGTFPELETQISLTWDCLDHLPDILTGQIAATSILFPDASMKRVEGFYKGNPLVDYFNQLVSWQLVTAIQELRGQRQPGDNIRILEIGAGTGGTTESVLKTIASFGDQLTYVYSDISLGFIQFGKRKFGAEFPFLDFQVLDIEKEASQQGFEEHAFDLIIASNVLHATTNIKRTVQNALRLLKADGSIILNEATYAQDFVSLTFGLLNGWWAFEDEEQRLPGGPLLSSAMWTELLQQQGCRSVQLYGQSGPEGEDTGFNIVVASKAKAANTISATSTSHVLSVGNAGQNQAVIQQTPVISNPRLARQICDIFAHVLMIDAEHIDLDAPYVDFGLDSLNSLIVVQEINAALHLQLRSTDLFNFPNIHELSLHIQQKMERTPLEPTSAKVSVSHQVETNRPGAIVAPARSTEQQARIAIIGMSGRFPHANSIDKYWQNLVGGRDCIDKIPPDRWEDGDGFWGGFVENIDRFDPLFFNISPMEAKWMDPQQRLFLQEAWRAFEHAGYSSEDLKGSRCGVFAGCREVDYLKAFAHLGTSSYQGTGNSAAMLSARIAYFLDLKGPSIAIDTACSSSLVAVHLACESIKNGTCDLALAGGVSLMCTAESHAVLSKSGMLSPDGRCKTFDDRANGFVPGEAVGMVLLKPLEKAQRDGDHIFGVIQAHGINQDGKTNGITASSATSQTALQQEVYQRYHIHPESISYVEAHGTGTSLGDPIEIDALTDTFRAYTQRNQFCTIGSVKTHIGHALAAAGIAGLIKVLLALQHKQLPPSLHFEKENRHFQLAQTPFYVKTEVQDWESTADEPRRAAISAFGFSGTNAHCVIEEAPPPSFVAAQNGDNSPYLIPLAAKTPADLVAKIKALAAWVENEGAAYALGDIATTLLLGRSHFDYRVALAADDKQELADALKQLLLRPENEWKKIRPQQEHSAALKQFGTRLLSDMRNHEVSAAERHETLLSLADLYQQGYALNWRLLYQDAATPRSAFRKVPLPTYPFVGDRYWLAPAASANVNTKTASVLTPMAFPQESLELKAFQQAYAQIPEFCALLLSSTLQKMGVFTTPGAQYSLGELRADLQLETKYHRLLDAFLNILVNANYLQKEGHYFVRSDRSLLNGQAWHVQVDELKQRKDQLAAECPQITAFLNLLWTCVQHYPEVLQGRCLATDVMFPNASFDLVKGIYQENATADFYNLILVNNVVEHVRMQMGRLPHGQVLNLLEIGAGTGGTSALLLDQLRSFGDRISYLYTDISSGFVQYGRRTYGPHYPFTRFEVLDIEKPIASDSRLWKSFDIIIAANVIHATRNLSKTLDHVKSLLKDHAYLFLNESTDVQAFATMTYGLLDGWWLFEDDIRLENSPLLDANMWVDLLEQKGFAVAPPQGLTGDRKKGPGQHILMARQLEDHRELSREPLVNDPPPLAPQSIQQPEQHASATPAELKQRIQQTVTETIFHILGLSDRELVMEKQFSDYGLDSISGIDFLSIINEQLGTDIRVTALFDYPSVAELSAFIYDHYRDILNPAYVSQEPGKARVMRALVHEEYESHTQAEAFSVQNDDIAIIGMSGRFSGTRNVHEYWDKLAAGISTIEEPPATRWARGSFPPGYRAGFLADIDQFDPLFFHWSGSEAEQADPQQRLFLEESYTALEDAGYPPHQLRQLKCGVFAGVGMSDYLINMRESGYPGEAQAFWGNSPAVVPARISYFLNLKGPSIAIDTACSASLVAIHSARQSILAGECDMALAGGVYLCTTPHFHALANKGQMLAADGTCKAFDQKADGFVFGEGAGVIVLKKLDAALRDHDHIYGVLKASGVNQDGKTNGITAPSARSQTELEIAVYEQANINPETISYVEAHGTGTKLGDPVEVEALTKAFQHYTDKKQFCLLGSVKTNIGHASLAAGIASVIKVLQAFAHQQIPPLLNFSEANEHIDFANSPFRINTQLYEWEKNGNEPRRAAISGFGLSGTNAHLVLEEAPSRTELRQAREDVPVLICLSAKSESSLRQKIRDLAAYLEGRGRQYRLVHIAYTLQVGREHFPHRVALLAHSRQDLLRQLQQAETGVSTTPAQMSAPSGDVDAWLEQLDMADLPQQAARETLESLAALYRDGHDIDWRNMYSSNVSYRVPLPSYPFDRSRFWFPAIQAMQTPAIQPPAEPRTAPAVNPVPKPVEVRDEKTWWQPAWQPLPLNTLPLEQMPSGSSLLVFGSRQQDLSFWQGTPVVLVTEGHEFSVAAPGTVPGAAGVVQIRPGEPEDYQQLADLLAQHNLLPSRILHCWSQQPFVLEELTAHLDRGVYAVLFMAQALMKQKTCPQSVHVIYAFTPSATRDYALNQAIGGFAKTLNQEHPAFFCQTLEVPQASLLPQLAQSEFQYGTANEIEVRYQHQANGERVREVKTWQLVELDPVSAGPLALKEQGTYLLIGGAGGLGLLFCQYLQQQAERQQSRISVFLTGRRPLSTNRLQRIEHLNSQWCEVVYLRADLSQADEARNMVAQARGKLGGIAGVFHFAGSTRDALLRKKTKAECRDVLAAKIQGTLLLEQALAGEKVDFLTLFSSGSAVIGNVGQSDYAYANAFLDAFAAQGGIDGSHTFSVNWAFWQDGGMQPSDSKLEALVSHMGVHALSSATGIHAWETILQSQLKQCMFLSGNRQNIQRFVQQRFAQQPPVNKIDRKPIDLEKLYREAETVGQLTGPPSTSHDTHDNRELPDIAKEQVTPIAPGIRQDIEAFLQQALADVSRLPVDKISVHRQLDEFGLDSLMITALNEKLTARFGPLPATLFFEYPNLVALSEHLAAQQGSPPSPSARVAVSDPMLSPTTTAPPTSSVSDIYSKAESIGHLEAAEPPAPVRSQESYTGTGNGSWSCLDLHQTDRDDNSRAEQNGRSRERAADDASFDIAIIGVSGIYPQAETLEAFWDNLRAGRNSITEIPPDRWNIDDYYDPDRNKAMQGKMYCKWGGFVDDFDCFDAYFFNISPREAKLMDANERLFLQTAWAAVEDAGYTRKKLAETCDMNVGIFAGISNYAYSLWGPPEWEKGNWCTPCGGFWSIANRVSYVMNLNGPSYPVDTACSSSLSAVHQACVSLKNRECSLALAGGASFYSHPQQYIGMSQNQMLSPTGKCYSFGDQADGFVPGEGVGVILLKPLPQALADGDQIYAVIKGSSVNHGGRTNGYAVPNPKAHAALIKLALDAAKIAPITISYVEAHGTGTALGDPIEFEGLCQAWTSAAERSLSVEKQWCALGSVKSNIGHLTAAAGISGLTKILLQMRHQTLVPSLNAQIPNPKINFEDSPFFIQQSLTNWEPKQAGHPRRAAVSSFGVGGANAHVIVEDYAEPLKEQNATTVPGQTYTIPISAKSRERLICYVEKLLAFWERHQATLRLEDVAYTLQTGREAMTERFAFVVQHKDEVAPQLRGFLQRHGQAEPSEVRHGETFFEGQADDNVSIADAASLAAPVPASSASELARLWVAGADIDWETLPGWKQAARRISLPTYPFAKRRYWYPETEADIAETAVETKPDQTMHLLQYKAGFQDLEWLGSAWLPRVFQHMGCFQHAGEAYTKHALKAAIGLLADYDQLYDALLDILQQADYLVIEGDQVRSTARVAEGVELHEVEYWVNRHPSLAANFQLLWRCLENMTGILQGAIPATDVLFPNSSLALVEKVYKDNDIADYYNRFVADETLDFVRQQLPKLAEGDKLHLLEIGAGTGGTSAAVFEALQPYQDHLHYNYTDISLKFIQHGRRHFAQYPFVDFQVLDIERDISHQGFARQQTDLVIATNVLHATRNLSTTLKNTKSLLRTGGKLIMNEAVETHVFSTLTFGLLKGWWLPEDQHRRLPGSPLLNVSMWKQALQDEGFVSVRTIAPVVETGVSQNVFVAHSDGHIPLLEEPELVSAPAQKPTTSAPSDRDMMEDGEEVNALVQKIKPIVAAVIEVEAEEIDPDCAYVDMGVDSILAIEIINQMNQELGIALRTTALFDHATVNKLAAHIVAQHGDVIEREQDALLQVFQQLHRGELDTQEADSLLGA